VRYDAGVREYTAGLGDLGTIRTGIYTSHGDRESEYGGLIFYAIHAVELMMAVHGPGIKEVRAHQSGPNFIATMSHANGALVALNSLATSSAFILQVYGDEGHRIYQVEGGGYYKRGLEVFLEMVRTGVRPIPYHEMVESIRVANAVEESLQTGASVML
jgi:hypothetical protein